MAKHDENPLIELARPQLFLSQVYDQCEFALIAARELDAAVADNNRTKAFYAIQNFLYACAIISKLLWGKGGKQADDRQALRDSIGVSGESPLRNRRMRNNFDHIDERFEHFFNQVPKQGGICYADKNLSGNVHLHLGLRPQDCFRQYDPYTKSVVFWGQEFSVSALQGEIERILPRLQEQVLRPPD